MNEMLARAKAWLKANPGKATAAALSLVAACGGAVSSDIRDWLLAAAPIVNTVIFGG